MLDALRASGCRIIYASPPDRAPFVITFETRDGERMGIVAYAFLATRTPTRNRPEDERTFQIRYGNKSDYADDNAHMLWQDPLGLFTTRLIGIDPELLRHRGIAAFRKKPATLIAANSSLQEGH